MADPVYCTSADVVALAGQLAVDLRTDDVGSQALHLGEACAYATGRMDYFCARYAPAVLAANRWVRDAAALIALRWVCMHRLNSVSDTLAAEWEERRAELEAIRAGKGDVPRAAESRRPVTVTNSTVDNRRANNQVRVDPTRSTGVARDYRRPTDPNAPDQR